jgi:hypothetical protein
MRDDREAWRSRALAAEAEARRLRADLHEIGVLGKCLGEDALRRAGDAPPKEAQPDRLTPSP